MALVLLDRAQETATANTTVSFTLLGADTGYQTLAGVGNTNTTYYGASDGTNWEVGIGTYSTTGPTLTRTTILSSSNSGAAVSTFGSPVTVFIDYPSSQSVYENASGVVTGYAISGGTIDGTPIGATTRAAGSFTTVTTTNDASISGLTVGKGGGAVSTNTAVGYQSLISNTTGASNSAFGINSLISNSSGSSNTGIGQQAMFLNTSGSYNAALGQESLRNNTTASNNTAVGFQAGYSNTTGAENVLLGAFAGYTNTTGSRNTFVGQNAGYYTTGSTNTFIGRGFDGRGAGQQVTTGTKNVIIGGYNGDQGGLDIRTASNYIVLSDGDGNPRQIIDGSGNVGIGTSTIYAGAKAQVNGALILGAGATPSSIFSATLFVKNGTDRNFAIQQGTADSTGIKFNTFNDAGSANIPIEINGSIFIAKTNETERMRITSAGDIGIGTTTPQTKFQLFKTSSSSFTGTSLGAIAATASVATLNEFTSIDFTVADYFSIPLARIGMQFTGSGSKLSFGTSNNYSNGITNTAVTIDPSGNVGIGTSAPPTILTSYSTSSDYQLEVGYASTFSWKLGRVASTGNLQFTGYNGGATPIVPMTLELNGNVGIGTSSPARKLDVNGSIRVGDSQRIEWGSGNEYITGVNNAAMIFGVANTERMRIDSSGNVGIGISIPAYKLDVAGGLVRSQNSGGTYNGYLLTSNSGSVGARNYGLFSNYTAFGDFGIVQSNALGGDPVAAGTTRLYIDPTGNVGIGTSSPLSKIDARSVAGELGRFAISNSGVGYLVIGGGGSTTEGLRLTYDNTDGSSTINNYYNAALKFATNNTERMRITSAGGVSFGATGTAYGTSGQALISAGDAPPTWGDVVTPTGTQTLSNKTLTGTQETVFAITDAAAFEINPANGGIQTITLGAARTPKGTNFLAGQSVTLMITAGANAITWTDATFGTGGVKWVGASAPGSAPTLSSTAISIVELWEVSSQVYGAFVGVA